jgi:hypothetical protein
MKHIFCYQQEFCHRSCRSTCRTSFQGTTRVTSLHHTSNTLKEQVPESCLSSECTTQTILCLKYLRVFIIIKSWRRSLMHHWKVTKFYFKHAMGTKIVMQEITLSAGDFSFHKVAYSRNNVPSKMFRQYSAVRYRNSATWRVPRFCPSPLS